MSKKFQIVDKSAVAKYLIDYVNSLNVRLVAKLFMQIVPKTTVTKYLIDYVNSLDGRSLVKLFMRLNGTIHNAIYYAKTDEVEYEIKYQISETT